MSDDNTEIDSAPPLFAGAGRTDITPEMGTQVDGDIGRRRPMDGIDDPLYARALVLEQEGKRFCLLSLDLLAITDEWADKTREMACERFGFEREAVAVHVTQTHSAPSMGQIMLSDRVPATKKYPWLRGLDNEDYCPFALRRIEEAIRTAIDRLEPVKPSYASELDGRVAFNRRFVMRDGTAEMFGGGRRDEILYREGPADPEVGVLALTNESGKHIAVVLHHSSHPTHGFGPCRISADWPGNWCHRIDADLDGGMALVANGCRGNVHHNDVLDPTQEDTTARMGELLAESTRKAMKRLNPSQSNVLAWRSSTIRLPLRDIPTEEFKHAHQVIEENPEPMWVDETRTRTDRAWCYAASMLDLEELMSKQDYWDYEVQALRVGDVGLVVLTGEPFVEAQLEIKMKSPAKRTYVAHMSNGYVGYIPTPHAIERGGYETKTCMGSRLAPQALSMVVEGSVRLLNELFA